MADQRPSSQSVMPLRYKTISPQRARWTNLLVTRAHGLAFSVEEDNYVLRLHARPPGGGTVISARLAVGDESCWLGFDELFVRAWLQPFLPADQLGRLPMELRNAVLEAAIERPIALLESCLGVAIRVEEVMLQSLPENSKSVLHISLQRSSDRQVAGMRVYVNENTQALLNHAMEQLPMRPAPGWSWLPMVARFEIGEVEIMLSELFTLGRGDLLLTDAFFLALEQSVRIRILPHLVMEGQLQKNTVIVRKLPEMAVAEEEKNGSGAVNVDELPVSLVFDIGEKTLTLKELQSLQPGYVFELDRTLERPVHLRVNGHRIGTGELVQIEDRMGVRIMELYRRPE